MPKNSQADLQGIEARRAASEGQSTHGIAAQASAARLISLLQNVYPIVTTRLFTKTELDAADIEKDKAKKEQEQLIAYLDSVIANPKNYRSELVRKTSSVSATARIIYEIAKSESYSEEDKKRVLQQMRSIAQTCPEFPKWNETHKQWSTNRVYHPESRTDDYVIASPAETLNLVCSAIADKTRFQASNASNPDEDFQDRIASLYNALLRMHKQEAAGQYEVCAAGRQHELLFLLNHTFLDKTNYSADAKPVVLLEDVLAHILSSLSQFVEEELKKLTEAEQSEILSEWILYQSDLITREVPPIVSKLRMLYPATSESEPDAQWQAACKAFLEKQLGSFGINPAGYKLLDYVARVPDIQPPGVAVPMKTYLLKAEELNSGSEGSTFYELVTARNVALSELKEKIRSGSDRKEELQDFYKAEEIFQRVYSHRFGSLMIGADNADFQVALANMKSALTAYFQKKSYLENFDQVTFHYAQQDKQSRERSHASLIENFFVNGKSIADNLSAIRKLTPLTTAEDPTPVNPVLLPDETLDHWLAENITSDIGTLDISSYDINRILIHALLTNPSEWSEKFCSVLKLVTQWLSAPENSQQSHAATTLKKAYPKQVIALLQDASSVLSDAKANKEDYTAFVKASLQFMIDNSHRLPDFFYSLLKILYEAKAFDPKDLVKILDWSKENAWRVKDVMSDISKLHSKRLLNSNTFSLILDHKMWFENISDELIRIPTDWLSDDQINQLTEKINKIYDLDQKTYFISGICSALHTVHRNNIGIGLVWDTILSYRGNLDNPVVGDILVSLNKLGILTQDSLSRVKEIGARHSLEFLESVLKHFDKNVDNTALFARVCSFIKKTFNAASFYTGGYVEFRETIQFMSSPKLTQFIAPLDLLQLIMHHENAYGFLQTLGAVLSDNVSVTSGFFSHKQHSNPLVECVKREYIKNGGSVSIIENIFAKCSNYEDAIKALEAKRLTFAGKSSKEQEQSAAYKTLKVFGRLPIAITNKEIISLILKELRDQGVVINRKPDSFTLQEFVDTANLPYDKRGFLLGHKLASTYRKIFEKLGVSDVRPGEITEKSVREAVIVGIQEKSISLGKNI